MNRSALQKGQARYRQDQQRAARQRVKAFQRWLAAGCPSGPNVPQLPSSHDYRLVNGRGR